MNKIIIKKGTSTSWENKTGLVLPLFKIENNEYNSIEPKDYPNNGNIFVTVGFERFENNYFYELNSDKIQNNSKNYEKDLESFLDGSSTKNPSFKIITNYNGDTRKLAPNEIIPIYDNKFSLNSNRLLATDGIISDIFFLKDNSSEKIFGPFEREGNELKAAKFRNFEEDFEEDLAFLDFIDLYSQYDGSMILDINYKNASNFIIVDIERNKFLVDFKNFISNNIGTPIDFTPIPILHKWALDKLTQNSPKIATILSEIKTLQNSNNNKIDRLKWDKYISLLDEIAESEQSINELVKILHTKNFIEAGIDSSEVEKLKKEIEEIKADLVLKGDANRNLKDRNIELIAEINEEKSKTKENSRIDSILFPNLSKALNIEDEINEIENILKEQITYRKLKDENTKLFARKDLLEEDIKKKENDVREIQKSVEEITKTFNRSASDHTAKLQEAKIYTDLLNGIEISPNKGQTEILKVTNTNIISLNPEITAKTYISEIQKRLANQGRELSFNDVANFVITINQSFITIIAGAPGVGKTSLVEKLSKSYGLNEDFGYLEIACAKGWTSSKDLIGFFNPLTNKFQPAKTKLKEALKKSEETPNAPYVILLDEANLSPIEHYWSDFIKLADTDYPRKIKISEAEEIKFGEGFRFVATINHDHTTEALSNRLIDRAAIIQLEKPNTISKINDPNINIDAVFDFMQLQNLFIETPKWKEEEESIEDTYNKIKEKLESNHNIIISPRKEIAIFKYCKVATGLLDGNNRYTALDYAISQHVLPLINGRGESFEILLKSLKNDLSDKGMLKSEKLLHKIIEKGKELKHFKYIYY